MFVRGKEERIILASTNPADVAMTKVSEVYVDVYTSKLLALCWQVILLLAQWHT
jgi:hypothetical protein